MNGTRFRLSALIGGGIKIASLTNGRTGQMARVSDVEIDAMLKTATVNAIDDAIEGTEYTHRIHSL